MPPSTPRAGFFARILAAVLLALVPGRLAAAPSLEYAVKAAFLSKFPPFVEWPPSDQKPADPFNLCLVGDNPFGDLVEQAASGQHVGSRPVTVRHMALADAQSNCQVMFIAGSAAQSVAQALDVVHGTPVLTVTDSNFDPGSDPGLNQNSVQTPGIIHFVLVHNRVNFDIDLNEAAADHLGVNSKLLVLAHAVAGPGEKR